MVAAAKEHKIDRYSITEHVSQFRPMRESVDFGSVHRQGRIFEDLGEYRNEFSKVPESALSGMKLRMGLEVDFSPRYEARVGEFVNQEKWDILLCSVHELADGTDIEATGQRATDRAEAGQAVARVLRPPAVDARERLRSLPRADPPRLGWRRESTACQTISTTSSSTWRRRRRDAARPSSSTGTTWATRSELVRRVAKACSKPAAG